nr:importin-5-like [Ipomoea batatas]
MCTILKARAARGTEFLGLNGLLGEKILKFCRRQISDTLLSLSHSPSLHSHPLTQTMLAYTTNRLHRHSRQRHRRRCAATASPAKTPTLPPPLPQPSPLTVPLPRHSPVHYGAAPLPVHRLPLHRLRLLIYDVELILTQTIAYDCPACLPAITKTDEEWLMIQQAYAAWTMSNFCQNCCSNILKPYLKEIITKLLMFLQIDSGYTPVGAVVARGISLNLVAQEIELEAKF